MVLWARFVGTIDKRSVPMGFSPKENHCCYSEKNGDTRYVHDIFGNYESGTLLLGYEELHYDQLT